MHYLIHRPGLASYYSSQSSKEIDPPRTNAGKDRSMAPPWLPYDMISEILSRTPVKSLCRFRCVSREWRALISDPAFVAAHRCRSPDDFLLVGVCYDDRTCTVEIKVMDAMDGKVMRAMEDADFDDYRLEAALDGSPYIDVSSGEVVDLATGQVLVACPPELRKRVDGLFTIGRVAAGAYKAVCVSHGWPYTYMILTLGEEDAKWRPMPSPPPDDGGGAIEHHLSRSLVTLNGVVHFLVYKETPAPAAAAEEEIGIGVVCFDLESETWKETIRGPPVANRRDITAARITLLNGAALCMVVTLLETLDDDSVRTEVWMLSDHAGGGGWTKAYSIPADPHVMFVAPLREMTTREEDDGGRKRRRLLAICYDSRAGATTVLRLYDPLGAVDETYAAPELPDNLLGIAGVCSLHLKHSLSTSFLPRR